MTSTQTCNYHMLNTPLQKRVDVNKRNRFGNTTKNSYFNILDKSLFEQ